jgi:general secretion pathway protein A
MFEQYWGLTTAPFPQLADESAFYLGAPQTEAIARIEFVVENPHRLAVLLGEPGTGKSLILERAAQKFQAAGDQAIVLNLLGMDEEDFAVQLADALHVSYRERKSYATVWRGILDELTVTRYQDRNTILFFDNADDAETEVLKNVIRLIQWKPGEDTRVTTVLAADSRRVNLLGPRLIELSDLRIDMFPWELTDTAMFVQQAIKRAGRQQPIFDDSGFEQLFELTDGVPRRVRQLAELCLVAAAGQNMDSIDGQTVELVNRELASNVTSV